jgi:hypothetical protein
MDHAFAWPWAVWNRFALAMDERVPVVSPQLMVANRQLHARRSRLQAQRVSGGEAFPPVSGECLHSLQALPAHLGWESAAVTASLRGRVARIGETAPAPAARPQPPPYRPEKDEIRLYPSLALGMLKAGQEAAGRLWLLLRYLDREGRGCLRIDSIKQYLSQKSSNLRLCGKRQLRNLLRAGQGVFWQRDKTRVWLRSLPRAAARLGVAKLRGRPVALPVSVLLGGIGGVRAHFYASFHSGRDRGEAQPGSPIARATLETVTGVPGRSQRAYEAQLQVEVRANYAIGERIEDHTISQEQAWAHGQALFVLTDARGYQGKRGQRYHAWQLPNSYHGPHACTGRGRQKHLNRHITQLHQTDDLRKIRDAGNERQDEAEGMVVGLPAPRYFHGMDRAQKISHQTRQTVYWSFDASRLHGWWFAEGR